MTELRPEYIIRNYPALRSVADLADAARQPAGDEPRQGGAPIGSVDRDPSTGALVTTFSESAQWPLAGITVLEPVGPRAVVIYDGGARGRTEDSPSEWPSAVSGDPSAAGPGHYVDDGAPGPSAYPMSSGIPSLATHAAPTTAPSLIDTFPWVDAAFAALCALALVHHAVYRSAPPPDGCSASLAAAAGGRGLTNEGPLRAFCRWHAGLPLDTKHRMAADAALTATSTDNYMVDWYIQNLAPR